MKMTDLIREVARNLDASIRFVELEDKKRDVPSQFTKGTVKIVCSPYDLEGEPTVANVLDKIEKEVSLIREDAPETEEQWKLIVGMSRKVRKTATSSQVYLAFKIDE